MGYSDIARNIAVPTSAMDYASEIDLSGKAERGLGPEFINSFVSAAAARLRPELAGARSMAGAQSIQNLGEGTISGISNKVQSSISSAAFNRISGAVRSGISANEEIRRRSRAAYLNVLTHQDTLKLQRDIAAQQIAGQEKGFEDYLFGGLSLAAAYFGS